MTRALLIALAFLLCLGAGAQDETPRVMARAQLTPGGQVVAGQQVRLQIEILTTTWFLHAPVMPNLDLPDAAVTLDDRGVGNMNTEIDGVKWFGLTRTYLITPNGGGDLPIPPIEITTYPGQAKGAVKVKTNALVLKVKAVERPGAENALASTKLTLTQRVTPQKLGGLRVGDAITRTITTSADGVRGMFLPPVDWKPIDGLAVYPKAPDLQDLSEQHAGFVGSRRTDSVTYVVQRAGQYTLPAVEVSWWNTRTGAMQKSTVPGVKFSAAANPAYKPEFGLPAESVPVSVPPQRFDWRRALTWGTLACAGLFAVWVVTSLSANLARSLVRRYRARRARYLASERAAFAALARSCRRGDAPASHRSLLVWIGRFRPFGARIGLDALSAMAEDPILRDQLDALACTLFGRAPPAAAWRGPVFLAHLKAARGRLLKRALRRAAAAALPSLNPY